MSVTSRARGRLAALDRHRTRRGRVGRALPEDPRTTTHHARRGRAARRAGGRPNRPRPCVRRSGGFELSARSRRRARRKGRAAHGTCAAASNRSAVAHHLSRHAVRRRSASLADLDDGDDETLPDTVEMDLPERPRRCSAPPELGAPASSAACAQMARSRPPTSTRPSLPRFLAAARAACPTTARQCARYTLRPRCCRPSTRRSSPASLRRLATAVSIAPLPQKSQGCSARSASPATKSPEPRAQNPVQQRPHDRPRRSPHCRVPWRTGRIPAPAARSAQAHLALRSVAAGSCGGGLLLLQESNRAPEVAPAPAQMNQLRPAEQPGTTRATQTAEPEAPAPAAPKAPPARPSWRASRSRQLPAEPEPAAEGGGDALDAAAVLEDAQARRARQGQAGPGALRIGGETAATQLARAQPLGLRLPQPRPQQRRVDIRRACGRDRPHQLRRLDRPRRREIRARRSQGGQGSLPQVRRARPRPLRGRVQAHGALCDATAGTPPRPARPALARPRVHLARCRCPHHAAGSAWAPTRDLGELARDSQHRIHAR